MIYRFLFVVLILFAAGCVQPVLDTPTPSPSPSPSATSTPTATATPSATPSLVPSPTSNLPLQFNPTFPVAIGSVNVLQSFCLSRASVWTLTYWGMTFTFNYGWYERCKAASEFLPTPRPGETPFHPYTPTKTATPKP